jgi:hypothetical protein
MWNNIVNTALLGTGKKQLLPGDLPPALADAAAIILSDDSLEPETRFLHLASLAYNYRQSGVTALQHEGVAITPAPEEILPYCSKDAVAALKTAVDLELDPLVTYWLEACARSNQIAPPEFVPMILDLALENKTLRANGLQVCGKRGEWLSQLNPEWKFGQSQSVPLEERWQNGTLDDRKQALTAMRNADPAKGREWLQQTWAQENANTRAELLKPMHTGLSNDDIPWLETLLTEKSIKIRDEAWPLLKKLPASGIIQAYWDVLERAIIPVQEKSLLGLRSKTVLNINLTLPSDKRIADSGIQLLSNTKSLSDDSFILYQLTSYVPPTWWEDYFKMDKAGVLELFQQTEITKYFIQALGVAAIRFKDVEWLRFITTESKDFFKDALDVLPAKEQEAYALRFFEHEPNHVIRHLMSRQDQWGPEISLTVVKWMANNPYQYNRNFFDQQIRQIPTSIFKEIEKIEPDNPMHVAPWGHTIEHIRRLMDAKNMISAAFHY